MRTLKVLIGEVVIPEAVAHAPRVVWSRREYQRRVNLRRAARDRIRQGTARLEEKGVPHDSEQR